MYLRDVGVLSLRLVGLLIVYSAFFLYEDQEGELQNRIERWWIKVDDFRKSAISKSTAFLKVAANVTDQGFTNVFGKRLLSARAIGISVCYSMASFSLFKLLVAVVWIQQGVVNSSDLPPSFLEGYVIFSVVFASLGIARPSIENRNWLIVWTSGLVVCILGTIYYIHFLAPQSRNIELMHLLATALSIALSFALDILFIVLTRWLLRRAANLTSSLRIGGLLLLNTMLGIIPFLATPLVFFRPDWLLALVDVASSNILRRFIVSVFISVGTMGLIDLVVCSMVSAVMLLMLLHRAAWRLIDRPPHLINISHWLLDKISGASG